MHRPIIRRMTQNPMHADHDAITAPRPGKDRLEWPGWPLADPAARVGLASAASGRAVIPLAAIALSVAYPNLPEIDSLTDYRPKLPMRVVLRRRRDARRVRRRAPQFNPIGQIPKVMQDAVLRSRTRAVLRAQRRRLHGRDARRPGQLGRGQAPGRIDDHDAGRAQFLSVHRKTSTARSTRSCSR